MVVPKKHKKNRRGQKNLKKQVGPNSSQSDKTYAAAAAVDATQRPLRCSPVSQHIAAVLLSQKN